MGKRGRPGGNDGEGQAKKNKYFSNHAKAGLPMGKRGVLLTCMGGKEMQAGRDAVRILTQFYDQLKSQFPDEEVAQPPASGDAAPEETKPDSAAAQEAGAEPDQAAAAAPAGADAKGKEPDMQAALDAELSALRKPHGKAAELWHWERANVNGLVWVTLNSTRAQPTPSQVVQAAAAEADKNKECMSRVLMRLMPIDTVCHADLDSVTKVCKQLFPQHFPQDGPQIRFAIVFEKRASGDILKRDDTLKIVAPLVPQPPHKVDLEKPTKTILMQIIKNQCAIGITEQYKELGKFNMRELSLVDEEKEANRSKAQQQSKSKEEVSDQKAAAEPAEAEPTKAEPAAAAAEQAPKETPDAPEPASKKHKLTE